MKVILLNNLEAHAKGVLPFQESGPLDADAVFFFKDIEHTTVSGSGLLQPIKVYALTRDFKPISVRRWPWVEGHITHDPKERAHILNPEMRAMLPYNAKHMVETADAAPTIKDFAFLKKYS